MSRPYSGCEYGEMKFSQPHLSDSILSFNLHRTSHLWDLVSLIMEINPNQRANLFDEQHRIRKATVKREMETVLPYGARENDEDKIEVELNRTQRYEFLRHLLGPALYEKCKEQTQEWIEKSEDEKSGVFDCRDIGKSMNKSVPNPHVVIGLLLTYSRWNFQLVKLNEMD